MELHTHYVVALYRSGKRHTIICNCHGPICQGRAVGVRVVYKRSESNALEETRWLYLNRVTANMRDLHAGGKALALPLECTEARCFRRFGAAFEEPLQANADAEERRACLHPLFNGCLQTVTGQKLCCREVAYSGQDNFFCAQHHLRIRSGHDFGLDRVQRLHHRGEVPRLVVNDCDHNRPFVLGSMVPICASLMQAKRSARANALKSAYTL